MKPFWRSPVFWILLFFLAAYYVPYTVAATGYCLAENGWLTDEEKLHRAISAYDHTGRVLVDKNESRQKVPYDNVNALLAANPGCCAINPEGPHEFGFRSNAWAKVNGMDSAIVSLRYLARYLDENGKMRTAYDSMVSYVSNCGRIYNPAGD